MKKYQFKTKNELHHAAAIEILPNSTILSFLPMTDWDAAGAQILGEDISASKTKLLMFLKDAMVRRG